MAPKASLPSVGRTVRGQPGRPLGQTADHIVTDPSSAGSLLDSKVVPGPGISLHAHPSLYKGKPVPACLRKVHREQAPRPPPSWPGLTQVPQVPCKTWSEHAHVAWQYNGSSSIPLLLLPLPLGYSSGPPLPPPCPQVSLEVFAAIPGSQASQQHLDQLTGLSDQLPRSPCPGENQSPDEPCASQSCLSCPCSRHRDSVLTP